MVYKLFNILKFKEDKSARIHRLLKNDQKVSLKHKIHTLQIEKELVRKTVNAFQQE